MATLTTLFGLKMKIFKNLIITLLTRIANGVMDICIAFGKSRLTHQGRELKVIKITTDQIRDIVVTTKGRQSFLHTLLYFLLFVSFMFAAVEFERRFDKHAFISGTISFLFLVLLLIMIAWIGRPEECDVKFVYADSAVPEIVPMRSQLCAWLLVVSCKFALWISGHNTPIKAREVNPPRQP